MPALGLGLGLQFQHFAGGFDGVLDPFATSILNAHSVERRLFSSYTGPLLRIRRSSDNNEQDIGFSSNGALNVTALLAFVGTGNGFVRSLYDQKGTNHYSQATALLQPTLVSGGVVVTRFSRNTMRFNGAQSMSLLTNVQPLGFIVRGGCDSFATLQRLITEYTGVSGLYASPSTIYHRFPGESDVDAGASSSQYVLIETHHNNSGDSFTAYNGTEVNRGVKAVAINGTYIIGEVTPGGGQALIGYEGEFIQLNSVLSSPNRLTLRTALGL